MRVAFDTSVLVAAAHARTGASFALLSAIPSPISKSASPSLSMPNGRMSSAARNTSRPGQTPADALAFLRYLAANAWHQDIFFHWRPFLPDPDDDMILELAFAAGCPFIVTHNIRHFAGSERLGVRAITPRDFLAMIKASTKP